MTKREKTKKLILIIFLLIVCSVLVYIYETPQKQSTTPIAEIPSINLDKTSGTTNTVLEINGNKYESKISSPMSVYDFMEQLQKEGKIDFKEKTYSGMGKFIEEINGVKGNGDKYWVYYINGKKAEIGISNYQINPGDVISWKYENINQ